MRENKHALQTMLDRLSPTIAMVQPDGTIVRVNRSWRRFAIANGYRNADLGVGTSYLETCARGEREDPTCQPGTCAGIRSVLDGQAPSFSAEYPCHSPSEQRWFRMTVTPYELQGRHGAVISHFDLSDLHETTRRLHRFGAYLDLLTKESGMGLLVTRGPADPRLELVSANVEAWLGYAPGALNVASAYWPSLVHPKDREVLLDILSDLDRRELELPLLRMLDRDGGAVAGQLRLRTLVDGTGRAFARLGLWAPASAKTRLRAGRNGARSRSAAPAPAPVR